MENDKKVQPVNLQLIPADYHQEDEISLVDIWRILLQYKIHIAAITLLCTIIALAYALTASPVYQAEAYIVSPNERDIEGLNLSKEKYSPEQIFQKYLKNFRSLSLRRQYFEQNDLLNLLVKDKETDINIDKIFEDSFNQQLSYSFVDKKIKETIKTQLQAPKAEYATEWVNKFIDFINHKTVELIKEDIKTELVYKINRKKPEIERKRNTALKNKQDRVMVLKEAYAIAERLGIKDRSIPVVSSSVSTGSPPSSNLTMNLQSLPLYTRGTNALSEELKVLNDRKDETPFIGGLRELESELEHLEYLLNRLAMETNIKALIVDQYATVPDHRIKPKRRKNRNAWIICRFISRDIVCLYTESCWEDA